MGRTVFLYAGQGSQSVGMGKDLYETYPVFRETADRLFEVLSFDARELMWNGPEERLTQTEYTQPCMAVFAASMTELLRSEGIVPDAAAGLSLGEYGAMYAAGVFDAEDYIRTVAFRGSAMAEAVKGIESCMSAVVGADADSVREACRRAERSGAGFVTVVNYNCPGQYVICGDEDAVAAAEKEAAGLGAKRCIRLKVSAPFHTKYLKEAGDRLFGFLGTVKIDTPRIPVAVNVTGDFLESDADIRSILKTQVFSSVHFEDDLRRLLESGYDRFIEIGPGNALTGFLKKTSLKLGIKPESICLQTAQDVRKLIEH